MTNEQNQLQDAIYSNDYLDLIFDPNASVFQEGRIEQNPLSVTPNPKYKIHFLDRETNPTLNLGNYNYYEIPHCYGLMDISALNDSGSDFIQNQSNLDVTGNGVLIGFLDTGIDYTHPVFIDSGGRTKILSIWDQTIPAETYHPDLPYGTEFTREQINEALNHENPFEIVPSKDTIGHGTQLAGIAAGNRQSADAFSGMAPGSQLVIVKLKEAKANLKEYYGIAPDMLAFQTTDLMMALSYLRNAAVRLGLPMVICIGLGTSLGGLTLRNPLEHYIENLAETEGFSIVSAIGNEGLEGTTYIGNINNSLGRENVEILVGQEYGFTLELWGQPPNIYSLSIQTPFGETMPKLHIRGRGTLSHEFITSQTILQIDYLMSEQNSGNQIIQVKFKNPMPGIWTVTVYKQAYDTSDYFMKLPIRNFLRSDTRFMRPTPDYSLVKPAGVRNIVSVAAYDLQTGNVYNGSSWGYINVYDTKPDLAAPGVNILVPNLHHGFSTATGSSIAAACTAGSIALLFEWMIRYHIPWAPNAPGTKNFLTRGARQIPGIQFPNKRMGYGKLDLASSYEQVLNL